MIVRNRGLGNFIGHQVMALEESAGYVPHDPLGRKVGKVHVNGIGETVAVDEGRRTLTLE